MSIFYGQYTSWWWLFVPSLFVASPAQYESCDFEEGLCIWDLRSLSSLKWVRTNQTQITNTDPLKGPGRDHSSNSASGMIFRQIRRPFCIFATEAMLLLLTASIWNAFVLEIKGRFKKNTMSLFLFQVIFSMLRSLMRVSKWTGPPSKVTLLNPPTVHILVRWVQNWCLRSSAAFTFTVSQ